MSTPEQNQQAYAQGYHVGYQHGLQAAQGQAQGGGYAGPGPGAPGGSYAGPGMGAPGGGGNGYPFDLLARYPQRSSRLLMFFFPVRFFLLIPHLFVLWFLSIAAGFIMFVAWFAVVFTGNYPQGLWNFMVGYQRWLLRVNMYATGLTDEYPPFSLN
jgi:hypothetical protein